MLLLDNQTNGNTSNPDIILQIYGYMVNNPRHLVETN